MLAVPIEGSLCVINYNLEFVSGVAGGGRGLRERPHESEKIVVEK